MIYTKKYWLEVDLETGNPTGNVCWAYYGEKDKPMDKPINGHWILVREVKEIEKGQSPKEKAEAAYQQQLRMQELNQKICEIGACIHKEHHK